jgi:hypothetical protein
MTEDFKTPNLKGTGVDRLKEQAAVGAEKFSGQLKGTLLGSKGTEVAASDPFQVGTTETTTQILK